MKLVARPFRISASIAILLIRCGLAQPPAKTRSMVGFRFDSMQAMKVQAPRDTSPQLHWVIPGIPTDTQVVFVEDALVKSRVIQELAKWRTDSTRDHKWLLDDGTDWSLIQQLNAAIEEYDLILAAPGDLRRPPKNEASLPSTNALTISVKETPVPVISSLAMTLETESAKGASDRIQQTDTVGSIATHLKRPTPEAPEAGIPVTLSYSKEEAQTLGEDFVQQALGEVALSAAAVLRKFDYRKGSKKPATTPQVVCDTITGPYAIGGGDFPGLKWPTPEGELKRPGEMSTDWKLAISGLAFVRSVQIDVGIGKEQDSSGRLAAKAEVITKRLNERFETELARVQNRIVIRQDLKALVNEVAQATEIMRTIPVRAKECATPECKTPGLVLKPDARWTIQTLSIKGAVALNAEEFLTGQVKASGDNLMLLGESETLAFQGGPQVQKATAGANRGWTRGVGVYNLHAGFQWANDFSQRFGGLSRVLERTVGPKYAVTDWILGPKATARFAPPLKPDPKRTGQWRPAVELELGFEFRGTDVRDAGQSPAVRIASQSGNTQAIVGSGRPRLRYDRFRTEGRGISVFDLDAKWVVREALPSGDFSFTQSAVTFGMTSTFGFRRSTDFLLRYRQGFGVSNGQTPLFQLLRLGGADSVRGMEQGEVVGRVMSFNQSEAGVALQPILDLFRHPKPLDPKAPKTAPSPMPFNLATTYIKLLYDRGFARDSASTADILKISHATHGYGAAVEVAGLMILKRRAALTIGYARSPGSYLHRSGLVITGISIDP